MPSKQALQKHSELQAAITRDFIANFTSKATLLYLENGAQQTLIFEKEAFINIGVTLIDFRGLPDVILFDEDKNRLFLMQAITIRSIKPISPDRHQMLEQLFGNCTAARTYINAFLDFTTYKRLATYIAWGTDVWIAEAPTHIIHYNGDKKTLEQR